MLQFTPATFLWMLLCLALGLGYAFALYRNQKQPEKKLRLFLFAARTLAVSVLAFLLFAPLIKLVNKTLEKPLIIIAQDNSASIKISQAKGFSQAGYDKDLQTLIKQLSGDYDVRTFQFGGKVVAKIEHNYSDKLTDISALFKTVNDQYTNRNVGAVILATDGIYNRGGNPQYEAANLKSPIYTVALGDTIPKRDVLIANVNYNNIVYLENQFQIEVSVEAYQCQGVNTILTVKDANGTVFSKPIQISSAEYRQTIPLNLLAKKKGIQRYTISLSPVSSELSTQNNTRSIFVEVINGKQKVLIVANSPHPDIAAIKQSIEVNKNYEVKTAYIDNVKPEDLRNASMLILHQLPSVSNNTQQLLKEISDKPVWFIAGAQSNTTGLSQAQNALTLTSSGTMQEVFATIKPDFYAFTLTEATRKQIENFAPLLAPFGNYALKSQTSVLLNQKVGRVSTPNPLLLFATQGDSKICILNGEGIWRWRLEDFQETGNHDAVDELVSKIVQYISSKDDKRKFGVYPARNTFDENDNIILNAELYNDAYQLINTPDVGIELQNKAGKNFSFLFSRNANAYLLDAGILPPGEYTYVAKTVLGNKKYTANGQFVIASQQIELQQTTANHQLLYTISNQSGGKRIYPNQLSSLAQLIKGNEQIKTISYENRRYEDLINLKIIFWLILGMLTVEWFVRKRSGEL